MNAPYVHKLLTGKVKQLGSDNPKDRFDRRWETGIFKSERDNNIWLGKAGLSGDEAGDKKNHGGPEKAVFAYPVKHYDYWKKDLKLESIDVGGFGENLALQEADEFSFFIGDTYQFGGAIIQVSQPRRPCWRPARRHRVMDLALRIQKSGKTGWYFRVLQEGNVHRDVELKLLSRPHPQWSIAACNEVMYVYKRDLRMAEDLASCEFLSENWKRALNKRLVGKESSIERRVYGPNKE